MPTISVILPVYNGEKYLRSAVESILTQTYPDFELILINDGSTDGSGEILDSFQDERIRRIDHSHNQGLISSLNEGITLAGGEYLARMDADDISLPARFERQLAYLQAHPRVGVLGNQVRFLDEKLDETVWEYHYPSGHSEIAWKMMFMNIIPHPAVMLRRDILPQGLVYDPDYPTAEDYELWTRLIFKTEFANLDEVLLHYRRHAETVSEQKKLIQLETTLRIRRQYISAAAGIELSNEQMLLLFQCPPYDRGLSHQEFKEFVELLLEIFLAYKDKNHPEADDLNGILNDVSRHIQSVYVKPFIVTEQVVVMREPTKEELRILMINAMPHAWQRGYGLLRRLHLISNPLPKDYYEE